MDVNAQQNNQNIIINGYKLIRPINSGNFGNVLLMEKDGHRYAVKQIKEIPKGSPYEKRLQREAIIPLNLNHENLIYYYGSFVENNTTYLVLEYYEGNNLEELIEENIKNKTHISQNLIITILKQCLSALCYLHDNNISHRDIKPSNILINKDNKIKLIDYGFIVCLNEYDNVLSGGKSRIGDRKYICPEILYIETNKYDYKGDIFCLGYTIFELMYLHRPTDIVGKNLVRINSREINNIIDNQYDQGLVELIEHMHKYYIEDRPSARESLEKLLTIEQRINNNYIIKNPEMNLKEIISAMKCVLHFFIQIEGIIDLLSQDIKRFESQLIAKFKNDNKLNNNIISNLFIYRFLDVLSKVTKWKNKQISDKDYEDSIKDFILTVNNRQNNKFDGSPLPLKLFYNILFIINREYNYNEKNIPDFLEPKFVGLLSDVNKKPTLAKIDEFKNKYKTSFLHDFYYMLIPITKCSKCDTVFKISETEVKFYLSLDNKQNDNIINDLVYNIFKPEKLDRICNCITHKGDYIGQKFVFSNLPKYLVFEIKEENVPIILSKILDMNSYTVSNENNNFYELFSIIYKDQDNYTILYKNQNNWEIYNNNIIINYVPISNIYNAVSLAIYKIRSI